MFSAVALTAWLAAALALVSCERGTTGGPHRTLARGDPDPHGVATAPSVHAGGQAPPLAAMNGRYEVALLAGGCFWGMEDILRTVPGVVDTEVGYTGGVSPHPTYSEVKEGVSGHAESIRVVFDPEKLSYEDLLEKWFFRMHDPTTRDRQGNDVGTQYRSAIFVRSRQQRETAEAVKKRVDSSGRWPAPVVTQIVEATPFTPAEQYHQDYLVKHPGGYTYHYLRD